jgi:RNA polymerase sigma-70 factor (ECF subfamily)
MAGTGDRTVQSVSIWDIDDERNTLTDDTLVQAAHTNPAVFGLLYQRYRHRIYAYLRARAACEEDAADLTQLVFLRALHALPRYRGRGHEFAPWLFRIARNVAIDYHRRQKPTLPWDHLPAALEPKAEHDPEKAALRDEEVSRLRPLVLALEPDKRELLTLRFAAGLTAGEIAAVVGRSEAAVRKQLSRTLQTLKEHYHATS